MIFALLLLFVFSISCEALGFSSRPKQSSAYVPSLIEYPLHFGDKSLLCISAGGTKRLRDIRMSFKPDVGWKQVKVKILRLMTAEDIWKMHWLNNVQRPGNSSNLVRAGSECLLHWLNNGLHLDDMRLVMFQLPQMGNNGFSFGMYGLDVSIRSGSRWKFWKRSRKLYIQEPENRNELMPNHKGFQILGPQIQWQNPHSLNVVMAYFKEDLTWMQILPDEANIIAYYKGGVEPVIPKRFQSKTVALPNEGRESHTFLYHVIQNYDNLADYTYFTLASVDPTNFKRENFNHVLRGLTKIAAGHDIDTVHCRSIANEKGSFRIGGWEGATQANGRANGFTDADVYPFGKWYKTFVDPSVDEVRGPFNHPCFTGMMIVPKTVILKNPREYYQRLFSTLQGKVNPEEGHYFERAWGGIFN